MQLVGSHPDGFEFDSLVGKRACVHVTWATVYTGNFNHVTAVDKEGGQLRKQPSTQELLSYRKLVVGHPFRFQIRVLRGEHIHFADIGTPEAFGYRCFQCISIHRTVGYAGLGNPFASEGAVVFVPYSGIETHLIEQLLLHDDVSGSLTYGFVH